jgi:hypothetical protein
VCSSDLNRENPDAPPQSKILSDCTSDARFRIVAGNKVEKLESGVVRAIASISPKTSVKGESARREPMTKPTKLEAPYQIAKVTVAIFFVPIMGAVLGFLLGGPMGAAAGALSCYAIVVALTLVFYSLSSKR